MNVEDSVVGTSNKESMTLEDLEEVNLHKILSLLAILKLGHI